MHIPVNKGGCSLTLESQGYKTEGMLLKCVALDFRVSQAETFELYCHNWLFAAVWKAEDTGSQFGAMHNLDASSVSSNIPWNPALPAGNLLITHAFFMKSEAD